MPQLGYVQKLKFNSDISFDSLSIDKISENLVDKTTFIQYNTTMDLYNIVSQNLGNNVHDVVNCTFDKEYLVQGIYCDSDKESGHEKIIFLKRKILENDTYTFLEFDHEDHEKDKYLYENIQLSDICNVMRNRNINKGVFIECDEDVTDIEFIDKNEEDYIGNLIISCDNEIKQMKYVNLLNIINTTNRKTKKEKKVTEVVEVEEEAEAEAEVEEAATEVVEEEEEEEEVVAAEEAATEVVEEEEEVAEVTAAEAEVEEEEAAAAAAAEVVVAEVTAAEAEVEEAAEVAAVEVEEAEVVAEVEEVVTEVEKIAKEEVSEAKKEQENRKMFTDIINNNSIDLIYTQIDFCCGLLNCYSQVQSEEINTILSKLMGQTIYGDGYVCMETNINNETRTMNMDKILFNKILDMKTSGKDLRVKNKYFTNIYNEL
jgi:hypothetical protein